MYLLARLHMPPAAGLCFADVTLFNVASVIQQQVDRLQCGLWH